MKKTVALFLLVFPLFIYSQTGQEIANVYFKRAEEAMGKINYPLALKEFNKGVEVLGKIEKPKVAEMGTLIHYELKNFKKGLEYSQTFFVLSNNKSSEQYKQMLRLFVEMQDNLKEKEKEDKRKAAEKLAREKELRKIDSLKKVWNSLASKFTLEFDNLLPFDKNRVSVFKKGEYYGLIDDKGKILKKAIDHKYAVQNEGFVLFLDSEENPKRVYCYNTEKREGRELPPASRFNQFSDYYEKVMLPRGDGRVVLYPENSFVTVVYVLESKKAFEIQEDNLRDIYKDLKKNDIIEKYDRKERTVRIRKTWYTLGNFLKGGIFTLYHSEQKVLQGFLITKGDTGSYILNTNEVDYLGNFYNGKLQGFKGTETVWIAENGEQGSKPKDEFSNYDGDTKIVNVAKGKYQLSKNGVVFLKSEKLEPLASFLKRNR